MTAATNEPFASWAVLELMGHRQLVGYLQEVEIAGGKMFRIDVPESCRVALPYPAKRCGAYVVTCRICGTRTGVTTAGRADDPRSLTVSCKLLQA